MAKDQVYHAVGKRKTSVARVFLQSGQGTIVVNDRPFNDYFPEHFRPVVRKPLELLGLNEKYDVKVNTFGGGVSAQATACQHGISRALCLISDAYRPPLKKAMLLTRDSRVVERKKYGHKKARKSFQFSKR